MTAPQPFTDQAVIQHQAAASKHAFNLAAALAELVLMIDDEARVSGRPLTTGAAVVMSDSRQALLAFHAWVEAVP